ncbi:MAG: hypothetical protein R8P61_32570 [Bacteroidia bacterium]|nr:hypothetical protein [Bacteroidia bacterium]
MDEQNIDRRLKERFESFEDSRFDEQNWERLSLALSHINKSAGRVLISSKQFLYSTIILLLLSNLILIGFLLKGNARIEQLMDKVIENGDIKSTNDTIYIAAATPLTIAINTDLPSGETLNPLTKPENRETFLSKTSNHIKEELLPKEKIELEKSASYITKTEGRENLKTQSRSMSIDSLAPTAKEVKNSAVPKELVNTPKDAIADNKHSKRLQLPKLSLRPGFFIGLPRISTDKSKTVPGFTLGVDLEFQLSDQLNLHTAISYLPLSYKIDDHDLPGAINQLIKTYPAISEDQSIRSLHEVMSTSQTFEIPLGIRYDLKVLNNSRVFVEGGIYGRWFLNQKFEYEFTKGESRLIRNMKFHDPSFSFGGFYAAFGNKIRLRKNIGEIEIFLKRDWKPQGLEGRIYSIWGLKGSYRLHP